MRQRDKEYVYVLCAVMYAVAIGIGTSCVVHWLSPPRTRTRGTLESTTFRTGDILLWASLSKLRTDLEKLISGSQYTHVSVVFVDRANQPYVWESLVSGHRVRALRDVLREWSHTDLCFLRKINMPLSGRQMETFIRANLQTRYSFNMWRAVVNRWCASLQLPEWDSGEARFCSQLVADTLEHLGALDFRCSHTCPRLLLPGDFSSQRSSALPWAPGIAYGPEIQIVQSLE